MLRQKKLQDLLFVNTETTGLDDTKHELLEVAAIRTTPDGKTIISTFEAKLKPLHLETAEPKALQINGYVPEQWTDALCMAPELVAVFPRLGMKPPWGYHKVDTVSLAWPLYINREDLPGLSLGKLCEFLGVTCLPTHRAAADVEACRQVYLKLMERWTSVNTVP